MRSNKIFDYSPLRGPFSFGGPVGPVSARAVSGGVPGLRGRLGARADSDCRICHNRVHTRGRSKSRRGRSGRYKSGRSGRGSGMLSGAGEVPMRSAKVSGAAVPGGHTKVAEIEIFLEKHFFLAFLQCAGPRRTARHAGRVL